MPKATQHNGNRAQQELEPSRTLCPYGCCPQPGALPGPQAGQPGTTEAHSHLTLSFAAGRSAPCCLPSVMVLCLPYLPMRPPSASARSSPPWPDLEGVFFEEKPPSMSTCLNSNTGLLSCEGVSGLGVGSGHCSHGHGVKLGRSWGLTHAR